MDKTSKILILLIGVGILFNILKERFFKQKKNEIIVAGHHVSKEPCISAMNELFGAGIDSSKICDCLIPRFYELIKNDPSKHKKFEEIGFFTLEGTLNDSSALLLQNCVLENITDTLYKLDLEKLKDPFLKKLKDTIGYYPEFRSYNIDSLATCLFRGLSGKITIKDYFSEDYMKVDRIRDVITNCFSKNIK